MWGTWGSGQLGGGRVDLALPGKGDRGGQGVGGALQEGVTGSGFHKCLCIPRELHAPLHNVHFGYYDGPVVKS